MLAASTTWAQTIAFVQGNYAVPQTPQATVTVSFPAAQTAGNLNVVIVGWNDSTATVTSVTDTRGHAYTLAVGPTVQSGAASQAIYYARNITGGAGNTVTVRFSVAAAYPDIRVLEYRGLDPTAPLHAAVASTGSGTTSSSGSLTTTVANVLLVAANVVGTSTSGPGANFTSRMITSPDGDIAEDRIVTTTGTYSATAPLSSSGYWVMQLVGFKSATGSDTTLPTVSITAPTAGATYTTTTSPLALGGSAADNVGVTQVSWSNNRGGSGIATGTATWSAAGIVLQPGTNVLTVTARDAASNLATATLTVTYTAPDTTLPTIAITSPTAAAAYTTNTSPLALGGTASDNVAVTQVTWSNDRGGSGTATGTGSWSVSAIALLPGTNVLTVTARDAANNSATAVLTVNYTAPGGLVGAYPFNETGGTATADVSGAGNNGTLLNGAAFAAGKNGNGLSLDGVNDYVNLGNAASLQITGSMTISAWINASAFPVDDAAVVSKRGNTVAGYQLDTTIDRGPRTIGFKLTGASVGRCRGTARPRWCSTSGTTSPACTTRRRRRWPCT